MILSGNIVFEYKKLTTSKYPIKLITNESILKSDTSNFVFIIIVPRNNNFYVNEVAYFVIEGVNLINFFLIFAECL